MGCDIHMVLEKKYEDEWVGINDFTGRRIKHDPKVVEAVEAYKKAGNDVFLNHWHSWDVRLRNYVLFGQLAGGRAAGPEPRGIPDNLSSLARMRVEGWDSDGHSHTHYLLSECIGIFGAHYRPEKILDADRHGVLAYELFDVERVDFV